MFQRLILTVVLVTTGCGPSVPLSSDTDSTNGESTSGNGGATGSESGSLNGSSSTAADTTLSSSGAMTSSTTTDPSTSGEPATTSTTSSTGSEAESSGESGGSGGEPEPLNYGPCEAGLCPSGQTCANTIDGTGTVCVPPCTVGGRCPAATSGDVNPVCIPAGGGSGLCALPCNLMTSTCPDGMECSPLDPDGRSPMGGCAWRLTR